MIKLDQQPLVGKYRNYSSYSDSGVAWIGKVPAIWTLKRVKHMFTIRKRIAGELGYDILSVTQRGIVVKDIESGEGQLSMDYSKYQRVKPGDFAMNHMDLLTGYVDISNHDGVTSPDYRVFTLDNTDYSAKYFLYIFQMGYQLRLFFHMGQGASHFGRWRLATDEFNEMVFPVPSFEEQQSIAAFLDYETARIDRLIAKQQQLIELLKEKRQAVISHAVTKGLNPDAPMKDSGVEWLGQVPEHWAVCRLKQVVELIDGDRSSNYPNDQDITSSGVPFLSSKNIVNYKLSNENLRFISNEKFQSLRRGKIKDKDLVITVRGTIGHVGIFDARHIGHESGFINAQMMILRPKSIESEILHFATESSFWRNQLNVASYGTAQQQLSNEVLGNITLVIPPKCERLKLIQKLSSIDSLYSSLLSKTVEQVSLMVERRTSLISAAVTGKIDLRGWTPPAEEVAA